MTATDAPTPRRYSNGIARRESILDAAQSLFVETGFGSVTMRQLAAAAGISTPGLLRHFTDKDAVLLALIARFEARHLAEHGGGVELGAGEVDPIEAHPTEVDPIEVDPIEVDPIELARRNAATRGYVELFVRLAGEATSAAHPAHAYFRERYERLRRHEMRTMSLADATRFLAAWDGLQLQSLYAPTEVDVVAHLEARLATDSGRSHPPFERFENPDPIRPAAAGDAHDADDAGYADGAGYADDAGYAPGRERRAAIVDAATRLFSREGFHHTTLREIAERTGIPKSTLLHHFSSKDELLAAVLIRRDATTIPAAHASAPPSAPPSAFPSARAELLALADAADANAASPGLIGVYTVLSSEGAAPEHPAHDYFERRMRRSRASFTALFDRLTAEGSLAPGRDPVHEATWLLGLWDGLQLQWLYDRDAVDVGALLRGHLESLLV